MSYHVPVSSIPLLQDPPFVLGLVWLGTALGYCVLAWLHAPLAAVSRLERGVLCAAIGLGLLQYLPFTLGMAGLLTPTAVWSGLALLTVLLAKDLWRVAAGIARVASRKSQVASEDTQDSPLSPQPSALSHDSRLTTHDSRPDAHCLPPNAWLYACAAVLAVPLAIAFLQALCPSTDYDGTNYHLTAPMRWLQAGRLYFLPTVPYSQWPMGVEMLFTLALAVWSDTAAKLIHFALGLLALATIFALGRRISHAAVGFTAAFILLIGVPKAYALHNFTYAGVDLGITFETVAAALAWVLWRRTRARGWLWGAALCAGFAASFKLTGAFVGLALAALTLYERRREGVAIGRALAETAAFTTLALLPLGLWLVRAWVVTGNPVWPWLSSVFPTRDWTPETARSFDHFFKYDGWGGRLMAGASLEQRKLARLIALALAALLAVLALWRARDREKRALLAVAAVQVLVSLWSAGIYVRYWMPVLPLVYIALLAPFARPLVTARWAHALVLAVVLFCTVLALPGGRFGHREAVVSATGRDIGAREALAMATGRTSRAAYLADNLPITRVWDYANRHLPPDARIMTVGFAAVYYCERYCYSPDWWGPGHFRTDTLPHFTADLQRDRIDYVAVRANDNTETVLKTIAWTQRNVPLTEFYARQLIRAQGRLVYEYNGYRLYRLEPPARTSADGPRALR